MAHRKLNILIICESSQIGGGTTVVEEIANELATQRHSVTVLMGNDRDGTVTSLDGLRAGISLLRYRINYNGNLRVYWSTCKGIWNALSALTNTFQPDLILINNSLSGAVTLFHQAGRSVPVYYIYHGSDYRNFIAGLPPIGTSPWIWLKRSPFLLILRTAQTLVLKRSRRIFCFSAYAASEVKTSGAEAVRITAGVNISLFRKTKDRRKSSANTLNFGNRTVLLCTSRFEARKGILLLLESYALLRRQLPDSVLVLATSLDGYEIRGEYFKEVLQCINHHRLSPHLRLLMNLPRRDLAKYYRTAHLHIIPSLRLETFGLVILEAFASGIPSVCLNTAGAPPEIIAALDSLLISKPDPLSLSRTIMYGLSLGKKPGTANRLRTLSRQYSWSRTCRDILTYYRNDT